MITKVRYADDSILVATSEAELQELVDRLDRVSRRYSLLISIDKTKVMASDGIACRILIQRLCLVLSTNLALYKFSFVYFVFVTIGTGEYVSIPWVSDYGRC